MASGIFSQIVTLVMPFVIRTIIIYSLGDEFVGASSLFGSILQVLSLAELGFATAMVFSMYKPIAEDNVELVCALLKLYRNVYRVIGLVILAVGLALMPTLPFLVSGTVPESLNLYVLYLLALFNTVASYFFFAYKSSLLTAHARADVSTLITALTCFVQYAVQILVLLHFKNYYAYYIFTPVFTILANLLRSKAVDIMYPQYTCKGKVDKASLSVIKKNVGGLFFHRIGSVIVNSTDMIVISVFFEESLLETARYANYYYISTAVSGFLIVLYNAISATTGNAVATKSVDENYRDFSKFSFMNLSLVGWCTVCLFVLYQPFMTIWTPNNLYDSMLIVACFCLHFYCYRARALTTAYKSAAGIYWEDRFCPLVSSAVNLILDLLLVQIWGIPGVLMATVFSMLFIETPWEIVVLFKLYFKRSPKEFVLRQLFYFGVTVLVTAVTYLLLSILPMSIGGKEHLLYNLIWLFVKGVLCLIVPTGLFALAYFKHAPARDAVAFVKNYLRRRLRHGS